MLVYHLPSLPQLALTSRASPSAGQFSFKTRTNRVQVYAMALMDISLFSSLCVAPPTAHGSLHISPQ